MVSILASSIRASSQSSGEIHAREQDDAAVDLLEQQENTHVTSQTGLGQGIAKRVRSRGLVGSVE